jgi:hypothetical protein
VLAVALVIVVVVVVAVTVVVVVVVVEVLFALRRAGRWHKMRWNYRMCKHSHVVLPEH